MGLIIVLVLGLTFIYAISRMYAYSHGPAPVKAAKPKQALPQPQPKEAKVVEEPIEQVIARIKEQERKDAEAQEKAWEEQYYASLPEDQHPDYFVYSDKDEEGDFFTQKVASGETIREYGTMTTPEGVEYYMVRKNAKEDWVAYNGKFQRIIPKEQFKNRHKKRNRNAA